MTRDRIIQMIIERQSQVKDQVKNLERLLLVIDKAINDLQQDEEKEHVEHRA